MDEAERLAWLKERIYRPREHVRARKLENGQWEVFDGSVTYTFEDEQFKESYELAAQSQQLTKYETGKQYEYHRS